MATKSKKSIDALRDMVNGTATAFAASAKPAEVAAEAQDTDADILARQQAEQAVRERAALADNPWVKIFTDPSLDSPEKKKEALLALVKADGTQDEKANQKLVADLTAYMEILHKTLKNLGIKQVETNSFQTIALLDSVTKEILRDLNDLKTEMLPFTDAIGALQKLREANQRLDFIQTVRAEHDEDKKRQEKSDERNKRIDELEKTIKDKERSRSETDVSTGRAVKFVSSWVTTDYSKAQAKVAEDIKDAKEEMARIATEIEEEADTLRKREEEQRGSPDYESRRAIRKFLDIGDKEIQGRNERIKKLAKNFIEGSESKVTNVIGALEVDKGRIQELSDTNSKISSVFTILQDVLKEGKEYQSQKLGELIATDEAAKASQEESATQGLVRKRSMRRLESFVSEIKNAHEMALTSEGDINENQAAVTNMARENRETISGAKMMRSKTIMTAAMRTSATLTMVSGAAGREALGVVNLAMDDWSQFTSKVIKDSLGDAVMREKDKNKRTLMMIERMEELTDVVDSSVSGLQKEAAITFALLDKYGGNVEELKASVGKLRAVDSTAQRDYIANPDAYLGKGRDAVDAMSSPTAAMRAAAAVDAPTPAGKPAGGSITDALTGLITSEMNPDFTNEKRGDGPHMFKWHRKQLALTM